MSRPEGEAPAGDTRHQTLLQEVFDQDYHVTEQDVTEYCEKLGISSEERPHLVPLVRAALLHPLPSRWTPVEDPELGLYFFNHRTGESRWNHPIDAIVRALITGENNNNNNAPSADSLTEELDEEELQISEFLKAHVSDEKPTHSDGNVPSEHTTTDACTLTSQCLRAPDGPPLRPPAHPSRPYVISALDDIEKESGEKKCRRDSEGSGGVGSRGRESSVPVPSEGGGGNVHADNKTQEDISVSVKDLNPEDDRCGDSVRENNGKECEVGDVTPGGDAISDIEDSRQWTEQGHDHSVSSHQRPSTASSCARGPAMFTGRDGLGRGLGRAPLGTPSLATPPPLGRPSLGGSLMGAARVPPIGGQLTPLAPIAAASRGGPPQLAPLKPVGSISQQPLASKEGQGLHSLRRPNTQEQQGNGRWPGKQAGGRRGEDQGLGDSTDQGLSSPPKSILKGPVLARGSAGRGQSQGLDRMQLLQPKETRNIRFDFRTDDLEFHTSEEEYDEELDEEEEEEEEENGGEDEEEEYEEEEEYDSEAEDPEEDTMFRDRDDLNEGVRAGLMLQDASDLLLSQPAPLPLKQQSTLPHGPDPWAAEYPEKPQPQDKTHDPLRDFRKEKDNAEKETKKKSEAKTIQSPVKQPQQTKPPETGNNMVQKSSGENSAIQSQHNKQDPANSSGGKAQQNSPANQNTQTSGIKSQNVKTLEPKQQEDRKLELEGAPKNRKVNPLDRVVAKLSGKTEERGGGEEPKPSGTIKNVTVNLTQLMTKEEESEDDYSSGDDDNDDSQPEVKMSQEDLQQKNQIQATQQEAEVSELRRQHETQLKVLKEQLNKEYHELKEKLKQEHNSALFKLRDQEKKTFESLQNQVLQKVKEENQKSLSEAKACLEEDHVKRKKKLLEDLEKKTEEELEQLKIEFVREMQQRKEELLKEHEEEMQELDKDLKELYFQQKTSKQEEIDATQAAAARSSNDSAAAAAAVSELEMSMTEVLRQRQTQIKREHNRQLATLEEKLDEELEKAARQAKERETLEKRNHSARLTALKDEHERELSELEDSHARHMQDLEAEHEGDVGKLKSEFRAELMRQKTELENKLTEFRIEYEQKMDSLAQEGQPEEGIEASEEKSVEMNDERKQDEGDAMNEVQENARATFEGITGGKKRLEDEEKRYDEILIELQERRKSLEGDLEELKAQENKVKELKTQHLAKSHSHCNKNSCIHETKYNRMKAKYSSLVNRIKSKKAKRSSRPSPVNHNSPSVSSDKSSMESNGNVWDSGQASTDPTLSTTSPGPHHPVLHRSHHHGSTSEASEDEEVRFATEILEKYSRASGHGSTWDLHGGQSKHKVTTPVSSTPKKAWAEDELLVHGRKELSRAEKFLKSREMKNHREVEGITAEDIHREILRQNTKTRHGRTSLVYGGSVTSDTESDEPTHDLPSPTSDFGLDRMLEQIGSANKRSKSQLRQHSSRRRQGAPYTTGNLEFGLNNPLNTHSSGPLRLEHLTSGSVPDLGPETVDKVANINHYLQQRWTSYFGELSVPLGGKVGWPAQVIGQSTLLANKAAAPSTDPNIPEKQEKSYFMPEGRGQKPKENVKNVNERIDDLRAWLQEAQATSVNFYDNSSHDLTSLPLCPDLQGSGITYSGTEIVIYYR
ncbi:uncharacterized protein LOC135100096 isoform X2 [Scylla paramamosain]|uniref:uncharacterized protein LOC135100096 isoform X2 n=1 Tax=Scylla paramamosain TaxID=85552 RepID=UPI0030826FFF